jgi:O-antigen/teichoic acid export membrane protein
MNQQIKPGNLKKRALESAGWTTIGYGLSQVLRLISNLALTHFLAPEYFGLMAIVNVFLIGLGMFSDIGIGQSIVQSDRANDRAFLGTAWTLQVIRGVFLWLCCVIAAWPLSVFYDQHLLIWIIPVAGLGSVIGGFTSTAVSSTNRNLVLGRLTIIELISQALAILLMLAIALAYPSVWVLVAGALFSALVKTILTHTWLAESPDKFVWDRESVSSIVRFGKWIFFSTALTFFIGSAGSLILGKFVSMTELGLFTIGTTLSKLIENIYSQLANKVIFPLYIHIKHLPIDQIRKKVFKIRLGIMVAFLPPLWVMVIFGQQIVDLLFDSRYHGAGWIFQVFSLGAIPMIISGVGPFYLAFGDSLTMLKLTIFKFVCLIMFIVTGWYFYGSTGIICGMALFTFPVYLSDVYIQRKHSIWIGKLDALGYALSITIVPIGLFFSTNHH